MKFVDLLKLSTRMFRARTSRTLLTILGMGVGIGAILFLVSFGYGLQKTLLERITTSESLLTLDVTESKSALVNLDKTVLEKIENTEGVVEVSPAFYISAQGKVEDLVSDLVVLGIKPSFLRLGGLRSVKGEMLSDENLESVVVSSSVVQIFNKNIDEIIGQEITFTFFLPDQESSGEKLQSEFKKVTSEKKYKINGIIEGDENVIYVNAKTLGDLEMDKFTQLKVKCVTNEKLGQIRDEILSQGFLVSSLSDTVDQANKVFRVIQIVLMIFGIIALIVSAIGMFNTMTIALLERTEEIGIMKSIGASNWGISWMFMMEATIMGFLGGLGGVALGFIGGKIFNSLINFIASRMGGQTVALFYSPMWFVGLIIVFAAVVGLFTGLVPARRASKINPLDALRYK
ncbi:MAG: FtsX-like permease family protein [Candidatus Moraniibacteriota bacterium]